MKVIVAETAGFCKGVKKAMEVTMGAIQKRQDGEEICTFGPLIHNRQVLAMLEQKGVHDESRVEGCAGKKVIIRAHGIPPEQRQALHAVGATILNATCQRVAKVQAVIKWHSRQGYQIIIVGDAEHAEVIGLMGYTAGRGTVISQPSQVDQLPEDWDKVLLVTQTTQNEAIFQEIRERCTNRYPNAVIKNTICGSTHERQNEVRALTGKVDAMVIVGGFHSGNTARLAGIARESGIPTYHVETENDLSTLEMASYSTVGVSAGASTPHWMIRNVVRFLESIPPEMVVDGVRWHKYSLWDVLINSNLFVALGAFMLAYAVQSITGLETIAGSCWMAAFYLFAIHTLNRYLDQDAIQFNDPERAAFDRRWQPAFVIISILAALGSLILAAVQGIAAFVVMLIMVSSGLLYGVRVFDRTPAGKTSILKIKDIPASKTLSVPLAWAGVSVVMPNLPHLFESPGTVLFAALIIFMLIFVRTAIFDLQDVQGDRLVGKETIVVFLGEAQTCKFILTTLVFLILSLAIGPLIGLTTRFTLLILPLVGAYAWITRTCLQDRLKLRNGFIHFVEIFPVVIGLAAFFWRLL
ncbi:MAG TPA: 4-hydroxy-3-methylbut-2-enyl diphosphate reductase [Syntrophobacteraceae bacterium]|nr:4-hydroxy-3-methylbut-2-enyl diphosphate reductase [Syntrophobacteraceae bacterium]